MSIMATPFKDKLSFFNIFILSLVINHISMFYSISEHDFRRLFVKMQCLFWEEEGLV